MAVVEPLKNDSILSGRSIRSFRHLELQNPSTGFDFIHIFAFLCEKFFLVPFLTTMEVVAPLENDPILPGRSIRLFRHL